MSLIITDASRTAKAAQDDARPRGQTGTGRLTRYLAILEDNKKASRFVPDDAALALDMAGFVRNRLRGGRAAPGSLWRCLALALVQTSRTRPRNNAPTHPRPSLWRQARKQPPRGVERRQAA